MNLKNQNQPSEYEPAGWLWTWQVGDPLPALFPIAGFEVSASTSTAEIARAVAESENSVQALLAEGHRAYLTRSQGQPVGFGWCATQAAQFGPKPHRFSLADGQRYLWGFATYPAFRGRGYYPRLLQAILQAETDLSNPSNVLSFWILHTVDNLASARGIAKAGFQRVGTIVFLADGKFGLTIHHDNIDRGQSGAALLGIRLIR